jgi:hypothetical protein
MFLPIKEEHRLRVRSRLLTAVTMEITLEGVLEHGDGENIRT